MSCVSKASTPVFIAVLLLQFPYPFYLPDPESLASVSCKLLPVLAQYYTLKPKQRFFHLVRSQIAGKSRQTSI